MYYSSAYHRISDDSVSSYGGHTTETAAMREALSNFQNDADIDHTWVRNPSDEVIWDSAIHMRHYLAVARDAQTGRVVATCVGSVTATNDWARWRIADREQIVTMSKHDTFREAVSADLNLMEVTP